jgi:hypothetical protein
LFFEPPPSLPLAWWQERSPHWSPNTNLLHPTGKLASATASYLGIKTCSRLLESQIWLITWVRRLVLWEWHIDL